MEAALEKNADHERIVFLDLNIPPFAGTWQESGLADELIAQIRAFEDECNDRGMALPPAVLVFTNRPAHFVADTDQAPSAAFLLTAVSIPEFRASLAGPGGIEVGLREKWPEVLALHKALVFQSDVPAAFAFDQPLG